MMPSCKQVSHMVSESLDGKVLSWRERIKLKIHLSMCKACQQMVRQMELLRAAANQLGKIEDNALPPAQGTLSQEASARIRDRLRQAQQDSADDS
jgi:predicted anti-sigma-YlaC factor YlaD